MQAWFICNDCGVDTDKINEYYMIHNKLWDKAIKAYPMPIKPETDLNMLCIGCCEKRLNRKLTLEDFIDAPINYIGFFKKSERFLNRLNSTEN